MVLVVPQCQLGVPVGVGYWFPLFQWSQEGVIDAPVADGCVDENDSSGSGNVLSHRSALF